MSTAPTILQNQDSFSTREYRSHATPLKEELNSTPSLRWFRRFHNNGFMAGILMYLCASRYDAVVTVSHRPAMAYGLLNRLAPGNRAVHIAKEFFFGEKPSGSISLKSLILEKLYRFSLKNVDAVIVNATGEIAPYAESLDISQDRFRFIAWPSNVDTPEMITENDGSIFAVGRSLRDWQTFFMAVEGLSTRCVVVASRRDVAGLRVPANVELHCDISHGRYLELLKQSGIVVLPLLETCRSTGQASFLEAMAYGKPVIVANVTGAWDYISDRSSGLLYHPGDADDLTRAIRELDDETFRHAIARGGFDAITARFNKKAYACAMLDTINTVIAQKAAGNIKEQA